MPVSRTKQHDRRKAKGSKLFMGYSSKVKAAVYVQPDLKDGDHSYSDLQGMIATEQEAANKANTATWPKQNSLTASEIKTLDGAGGKSEERNAIGAPVSLVTKQPRGFKGGTSTPDVEGESK